MVTATERLERDRVRFMTRVTKNAADCWIWAERGRSHRGYGLFPLRRDGANVTVLAHRLSWEWRNGPIPAGIMVCHRCDVPACVNPDHLFLGTAQDNSNDMKRKGRAPTNTGRDPSTYRRGEGVRQAKLAAADIPEIINARAAGETFTSIASRYDVRHSTIQRIVSGCGWRHIQRPA